MSNKDDTLANQWFETHLDEFKKETDRAAVILTTSIFEQVLESLIKHLLIPCPTSNDSLFEGPTAPLSTFNAKIDMCHRLGLISARFARDLHLIRKIRNKFAHNVLRCNFDDCSVKSLVDELVKSSHHVLKRRPRQIKEKVYGKGVRGDFCTVTSWMLYVINQKNDNAKNIIEPDLEWGYKPTEQ